MMDLLHATNWALHVLGEKMTKIEEENENFMADEEWKLCHESYKILSHMMEIL